MNTSGQLGIGNLVDQSAPVQVGTRTDHVGLSAGGGMGILTVVSNGDLYGAVVVSQCQLFSGVTTPNVTVLSKATGNIWRDVDFDYVSGFDIRI